MLLISSESSFVKLKVIFIDKPAGSSEVDSLEEAIPGDRNYQYSFRKNKLCLWTGNLAARGLLKLLEIKVSSNGELIDFKAQLENSFFNLLKPCGGFYEVGFLDGNFNVTTIGAAFSSENLEEISNVTVLNSVSVFPSQCSVADRVGHIFIVNNENFCDKIIARCCLCLGPLIAEGFPSTQLDCCRHKGHVPCIASCRANMPDKCLECYPPVKPEAESPIEISGDSNDDNTLN